MTTYFADYLNALTSTENTEVKAALLAKLAQALEIVAGDVVYGSGANALARLAKGNDGDVLALASGVPAWTAPSAGGGGWTPIGSAVTVSSPVTPIDFTSIPDTYTELMFVVEGLSHNGADTSIGIAISTNNGSAYSSAVAVTGGFFTSTQTAYGIVQFSNYSGNAGSMQALVGNLSSSPSMIAVTTSAIVATRHTGGIDAIRFVCANAANFDAGTITLYGR